MYPDPVEDIPHEIGSRDMAAGQMDLDASAPPTFEVFDESSLSSPPSYEEAVSESAEK